MMRPGTGVHKDQGDAAGGLAKSFLEIRLPYVRLVHYPESAPVIMTGGGGENKRRSYKIENTNISRSNLGRLTNHEF